MERETWRLIETFGCSAEYAMGLDEALLRSVGSAPTLRLYSWHPDAISLGYFQAFRDVPAAAGHGNVVRRLTGGGAIHHHPGELTFSIAIDAEHPAYRGSVPDSYERSHGAVIAALEALGVMGVRMRRGEPSSSDRQGTGMCFHESTPQDISWEVPGTGFAKGVGTAQRRVRENGTARVLHHGSIKLTGSPLEPGVATVADVDGVSDLESAASEVLGAFAREFGATWDRSTPTPDEERRASVLGARYSSTEFVHRDVRRGRRS